MLRVSSFASSLFTKNVHVKDSHLISYEIEESISKFFNCTSLKLRLIAEILYGDSNQHSMKIKFLRST